MRTLLPLLLLAVPASDEAVHFEDLGLTITPPALEGLAYSAGSEGAVRGTWTDKVGPTEVTVQVVQRSETYAEPDEVNEQAVDDYSRGPRAFVVAEDFHFQGDFGYAAFAAGCVGELFEEGRTGAVGTRHMLSSLLEGGAWSVVVDCLPRADEKLDDRIRAFLEDGIAYEGPERDPDWTRDEVRERWLQDAPPDLHEDYELKLRKPGWVKKAIIRTDHYLVMTNSSSGKAFAKQLEKNYDAIQKIYPFKEVKGRRLMPVFLFQNADEYYEFYSRIAGISKQQASRSKGHAWKDYYATWYEEPGDSVHIHEQVHQIFKNRLGLWGGGSWFQEGAAEYVSSTRPERVEVAYLVKKGRHTPLREFLQLPSLLYSSNPDGKKSGGSEAGDHYTQAALLFEFLREDRSRKKQFPEFLQRMGKVPRGYMTGIAAVLEDLYEEDVDELDAAFQAWAKKR